MRKKRFLAVILLGVVFCFVSGAGYGEVIIPPQRPSFDQLEVYREEPLFGMISSLRKDVGRLELQNGFLEATIDYIMRNPTVFLNVKFFYDQIGYRGVMADLPSPAHTENKIYVEIVDNRNMFSSKARVALLNQFKRSVEVIYSFIKDIATDMDDDIVAKLYSKEGIPLAYFYQGKYHLWEE